MPVRRQSPTDRKSPPTMRHQRRRRRRNRPRCPPPRELAGARLRRARRAVPGPSRCRSGAASPRPGATARRRWMPPSCIRPDAASPCPGPGTWQRGNGCSGLATRMATRPRRLGHCRRDRTSSAALPMTWRNDAAPRPRRRDAFPNSRVPMKTCLAVPRQAANSRSMSTSGPCWRSFRWRTRRPRRRPREPTRAWRLRSSRDGPGVRVRPGGSTPHRARDQVRATSHDGAGCRCAAALFRTGTPGRAGGSCPRRHPSRRFRRPAR